MKHVLPLLRSRFFQDPKVNGTEQYRMCYDMYTQRRNFTAAFVLPFLANTATLTDIFDRPLWIAYNMQYRQTPPAT
jgi:hypothetical protein